MGFEPTTSGLEVQRAIHCATGTYMNSYIQGFLQLNFYIFSDMGIEKKKEKKKNNNKFIKTTLLMCPRRGLNPGSSVYETDALPLGHRG